MRIKALGFRVQGLGLRVLGLNLGHFQKLGQEGFVGVSIIM